MEANKTQGGKKMKTAKIEEFLNSPSAHNWAKDVLRTALEKDACDAVTDLEYVTKLLQERLNVLLGKETENNINGRWQFPLNQTKDKK